MKNKIKWFCGFLALFMGLSITLPSATEVKAALNTEKSKTLAPAPSFSKPPLEKLGLSESEMKTLLLAESSGITLRQGVAYDKNGLLITDNQTLQKGKLSWAAKALKKVWYKLPTSVRTLVGYTGFQKVVNIVDHFSGTVEDAIQKGLMSLGFSRGTAWWITKILTFIAF